MTPGAVDRTRRTSPAAHHAVQVLKLLAGSGSGMAASQLATAVGVPRSSMYQVLQALCDGGLVVHLPEERRYGLGLGAFELGSAYMRRDPLERLARPLLANLVTAVGETAHLSVLRGAEVVYLLKQQPERPTAVVTDVGVRLPAHLTASGMAILSRLPVAQVKASFSQRTAFVSRTGQGPSTLRDLLAGTRTTRARGFALEDGLVTPGVVCLAMPVLENGGRPVAAISVPFVRNSLPEQEWPDLAARIGRAADQLTRRLGGTPGHEVRAS